jgi:hypothetical protein
MSLKENQQSQNSTEPIERAAAIYRHTIQMYPEEVWLWTRRKSKDILSIVRDVVVLGLPGFIILRAVEFLDWRENFIKNLTFAGAVWYVNQFSKEE